LKIKLDKISGYDYIIFDSPPSLGIITINIMTATDEIVIPVNMTYFALDGCAEIVETVEMVRKSFRRPNLKISLVVATLYRNTNLAREIYATLYDEFGKKLSKNIIRVNVKVDEAQSHGRTIWEYAPSSHGALMIEAVARELARKKE
jgi:chromosome partitioning protein